MKTLIRWVARLYPRAWRERYGEEYEALLEDVNPGVRTAWNVFGGAITMQVRKFGLTWIAAISLVIAGAAFAAVFAVVPREYQSQGLLRADSAQPAQVRNDWLMSLLERVETGQSLRDIIVGHNLYPGERGRMRMGDVINLMRSNIKVTSPGGSNALGVLVDFRYSDPQLAQRVATQIIYRMVDENLAAANPGVTVKVLDPASLPTTSVHNSLIEAAMTAASAGLLTLGGLLLWRRKALRRE